MHWRHEHTGAIFAAVLPLLGYLFTPWAGLGLVPIAWFFWVMGRRIGGDWAEGVKSYE